MGEALKAVADTLFGTGETSGVIPTVFSWITSATVLPYFAIGIACSLSLFGVVRLVQPSNKQRAAAYC